MSHIKHTICRSGIYYYNRRVPKQAVKTKPKAQKEEVVKIEDIPQEEPILYDGHAWTPQHFVTSFKSIQESDLGATTKESLLEMWKTQKEQFTLLKDNDSELYDELINFLAVTKANLPSEEIYEQGDKDEK